jgi:hypothetical protein
MLVKHGESLEHFLIAKEKAAGNIFTPLSRSQHVHIKGIEDDPSTMLIKSGDLYTCEANWADSTVRKSSNKIKLLLHTWADSTVRKSSKGAAVLMPRTIYSSHNTGATIATYEPHKT